MQLPQRPDQWTIDTVKDLLSSEHYERPEFEFKEVLVPRGPNSDEIRERVRHCALAFANSMTGHFIFGVKDRSNEIEPVKRLVGIEAGDHRLQFGELVKEADPGVAFEVAPRLLPVPLDTNRGVLVVQVPLSSLRPHAYHGVFYKRVHAGAVLPMTRQEVLEAMIGTTDRLNKVELLRLDLSEIRRAASALKSISSQNLATDMTYSAKRYEVEGLKSLLIDLGAVLPVGERAVECIIDLASTCREQNRTLDRLLEVASGRLKGIAPGMHELWIAGVQSEAARLCTLCQEIEKLLHTRFGPSPATS